MKAVIVGGVAGGASCAARLRRLDEKAEIVMVERGPYMSYANCGLPYHISGVIENESSLLVSSLETFRALFAIDARTNCEAIAVDPKAKTVQLRNVTSGELTTETYDKLVLAPGAVSVPAAAARHRPSGDLPGADRARRAHDPRVDPARHRVPGGPVQLFGDAVRQADAPRAGRRRRLHRPGNG